MKKLCSLLTVLAFLLVIAGCETNKTRVAEGAGIGGAVGALAGGIIGHQTGSGVEGALIGGALGAGTGALVGAQINKPGTQAGQNSAVAQNTPMAQLTIQQVVDLTKQGATGDDIIAKIKATNSKYSLTLDDVNYLRNQGVSQRVIETMQAAK